MIRAIIFDCFGVLITDALKVVRDDLYRMNPEGALEVDELVRAANVGLLDPQESSERIAMILGVTTDAFRAKIAAGEQRNQALFQEILHLKMTYKTAMLSNISVPSLQKRFSRPELNTYFDEVILSGEVGFAKPEAAIYEIAAERLGARCDECVFIDDRETFVEAAQAVGMQGIVYKHFAQFQTDLKKTLERE